MAVQLHCYRAAFLQSWGCLYDHLPRQAWQMSRLLLFVSRVTTHKMHFRCRVGTMARHLGLVEAQALHPATSPPRQRQASGDASSQTCLCSAPPAGCCPLAWPPGEQASLTRHCTLSLKQPGTPTLPCSASNLLGPTKALKPSKLNSTLTTWRSHYSRQSSVALTIHAALMEPSGRQMCLLHTQALAPAACSACTPCKISCRVLLLESSCPRPMPQEVPGFLGSHCRMVHVWWSPLPT